VLNSRKAQKFHSVLFDFHFALLDLITLREASSLPIYLAFTFDGLVPKANMQCSVLMALMALEMGVTMAAPATKLWP